jgi:hypothetical protein
MKPLVIALASRSDIPEAPEGHSGIMPLIELTVSSRYDMDSEN